MAMAHGYFKVEGKPMAVLAHGTVGLQHASMAIYNAWCDRVPVYVMLGNSLDATQRRPGVEWDHSVQDAAAMVRDFVKWDDMPISLQHFAESAVRAYKIAMTPPMMPGAARRRRRAAGRSGAGDEAPCAIPKLTLPLPPQGDSGRRRRNRTAARRRRASRDRRGSARAHARRDAASRRARRAAAGPGHRSGRAHEFPVAPSAQSAASARASSWRRRRRRRPRNDATSGAPSTRIAISCVRRRGRSTKPGTKLVSITTGDLFMKANYQDFQRYPEVDLAIAADAEATLPSLIDAVKRRITPIASASSRIAARSSPMLVSGCSNVRAATRRTGGTRVQSAQPGCPPNCPELKMPPGRHEHRQDPGDRGRRHADGPPQAGPRPRPRLRRGRPQGEGVQGRHRRSPREHGPRLRQEHPRPDRQPQDPRRPDLRSRRRHAEVGQGPAAGHGPGRPGRLREGRAELGRGQALDRSAQGGHGRG